MTKAMSSFHLILPAAGAGRRFGSKKQFLEVQGQSLLERTLSVFLETQIFKSIIVCLPKEELSDYQSTDFIKYVQGGTSRAESVYKGFQALSVQSNDFVVVHDAVRPFVSSNLIQRLVRACETQPHVIPYLPMTDTIKEMKNSKVIRSLDRSVLASVQTPQAFLASDLKEVYQSFAAEDSELMTDEAMMLEKAGKMVSLILGEKTNIKITTPEDLKMAEFILSL